MKHNHINYPEYTEKNLAQFFRYCLYEPNTISIIILVSQTCHYRAIHFNNINNQDMI